MAMLNNQRLLKTWNQLSCTVSGWSSNQTRNRTQKPAEYGGLIASTNLDMDLQCHLPLVPGRANAEVSKKNNDYKKPMAYRNVCDIQQR